MDNPHGWWDDAGGHRKAALKGWHGRKGYASAPRGYYSNPELALANPKVKSYWRRKPKHNPSVRGVQSLARRTFAGYGLDDVALAALAMIGIQKAQEFLPENLRTGWADPISAAILTGAGVFGLKDSPKIGRAVGMGGGIATMLKVAAQIPALNAFVSPGSLVIGRHRPRAVTMPVIQSLPSGGKISSTAPSPAPAAAVRL